MCIWRLFGISVIFIIMETKKCIKCNEVKPLSEFNKNAKKRGGVNALCKICHKEYRRDHYLKNKEKVYKQVKEYRILNPEKYVFSKDSLLDVKTKNNKKAGRIFEKNCSYCESTILVNKTDFLSDKKQYCSLECKKTSYKSNYYHYLRGIPKRAKNKKIEYNLSEDFIRDLLENKQNNKCAITGCPIKIKEAKLESLLYETASLDRIDSNKGYTKDNVHWVMLGINYMKMDCSVEELIKTLDLIKEYYKK